MPVSDALRRRLRIALVTAILSAAALSYCQHCAQTAQAGGGEGPATQPVCKILTASGSDREHREYHQIIPTEDAPARAETPLRDTAVARWAAGGLLLVAAYLKWQQAYDLADFGGFGAWAKWSTITLIAGEIVFAFWLLCGVIVPVTKWLAVGMSSPPSPSTTPTAGSADTRRAGASGR